MRLPKPTLVFDLDGTLVDSAPDLVATLNAILSEEGYRPVSDSVGRGYIGQGAKVMLTRGLEANGAAADPVRIDALYHRFIDHYVGRIAEESRPYAGVEETLEAAAAEGWNLIVLTNKLEHLAFRLLDAVDLTRRFTFIAGQDTFAAPKPDPETFRRAVLAGGGTLGRAVMIGDSRTDIDTAKNADAPVVAVTFGYTDEPVHEMAPDALVDSFAEIPAAAARVLTDRLSR
ncbi:HAD-IA family hydrolase [Segnochrobactraceae bacterium EtOH-i3]